MLKEFQLDNSSFYRNSILVLLLICVALIVHNVFSQNGYLASRRQRRELHELQQKIQQIKVENQELDHENHDLKTNPAAVERLAREQYGLAKPGEKIYPVPNNSPASAPPSARQ